MPCTYIFLPYDRVIVLLCMQIYLVPIIYFRLIISILIPYQPFSIHRLCEVTNLIVEINKDAIIQYSASSSSKLQFDVIVNRSAQQTSASYFQWGAGRGRIYGRRLLLLPGGTAIRGRLVLGGGGATRSVVVTEPGFLFGQRVSPPRPGHLRAVSSSLPASMHPVQRRGRFLLVVVRRRDCNGAVSIDGWRHGVVSLPRAALGRYTRCGSSASRVVSLGRLYALGSGPVHSVNVRRSSGVRPCCCSCCTCAVRVRDFR